jgi:hypothetical protein
MKSVDCMGKRERAKTRVMTVERQEGALCHVQTAQLFSEFIARGSKI